MNEAAQSLIERAQQAESQAIANILLESAQRIDPSVDIAPYKRQWLDKWMEREYKLMQERMNP